MAELFRLVNYYNLPRYMYIYTYPHTHIIYIYIIYIMHISKKNTEACRFTWLCGFKAFRFHQDDFILAVSVGKMMNDHGLSMLSDNPVNNVACRLAIHRSPLFFSWKWIVNARGSFVMCDCQRVYRRFWILLIQICAPQYYAPISRCNVVT
jgi:hypothetical protein